MAEENKKILTYIHQFGKTMKTRRASFIKEYSYMFCAGLAGMFPGGEIAWDAQSGESKYYKDGLFYDAQGVWEPDSPFVLPAKSVPEDILANCMPPFHMNSQKTLAVMNTVEKWRENIRTLLNSHIRIEAGVMGHDFVSAQNLSVFAERFLLAKPDSMGWVETLYMVCVNPVRTGIEPNITAMVTLLNNLKNIQLEPYFRLYEKHGSGTLHTIPYDYKTMHYANGAVKCVLHTPWAYLGEVRAIINLSRTEKGFSWQIGSWYNELRTNENNSVRNKGWGRECLKVLAKELEKDYGAPIEVSYVWNGQNDFVGELVTQTWHGVCETPVSVLKNESADSWDSHIYKLDKDAFLDWLMK